MHADADVRVRDAGALRGSEGRELGGLALGEFPGRTSDEENTFFKSVGNAVQDIAVAAFAVEKAREEGIGQEINLG